MHSIDITHPHGVDNQPHSALDEAFLTQLSEFDDVERYRYLPLDLIIGHKQGLNRRKDRKDIRLIRRFQTQDTDHHH